MKILFLSVLFLPTNLWAANSLPVEFSLTCDASYLTTYDRPASRQYHPGSFTFRSKTGAGKNHKIEFNILEEMGREFAEGTALVMPDDWGVNSDGSPYMAKLVFDGKIVDGLVYNGNTYNGTTFNLVLGGRDLLKLLEGSIEELVIPYKDRSNIWKRLDGSLEASVIYDSGQGSRWDQKINQYYHTRRLGECYGWVKRAK